MIKRIFTCENKHSYESKTPIVSEWFSKHFGAKINDRCKICGGIIMKEEDYVNGELVMGAFRR